MSEDSRAKKATTEDMLQNFKAPSMLLV